MHVQTHTQLYACSLCVCVGFPLEQSQQPINNTNSRGSCNSSIISTELAQRLVPTTTLQLNQQYPPTHWVKPCNVRICFSWPFLCTSAAGWQLMRTTASINIPKPTRWVAEPDTHPHNGWFASKSFSCWFTICHCSLWPVCKCVRVYVCGCVCLGVWPKPLLNVDSLTNSGKTYNWFQMH